MGGLFGFAARVNLATVHRCEVVQQRLDRLNPWVLAAPINELADEAQGDAGLLGDGFKAGGAGLTKSAFQLISNWFNGVGHGS